MTRDFLFYRLLVMKEYIFYFRENYGGNDIRDISKYIILRDNQDPAKFGIQEAKDMIYGKKSQYKMFGTPRRFYDVQYKGYKFSRNVDIKKEREEYRKNREQEAQCAEIKLKKEVEKMGNYDYYEIKFVWHGADCKRRAADLEEAKSARTELKNAGVKDVTIYGVKKGSKEIQNTKKQYVKPEFKHEKPEPKKEKPKKTATKNKKTAVKMTGTSGTFTTDYKTEKKAKAAAKNIRKLGYKTEIIEPAGQLDLFSSEKKASVKFNYSEILEIRNALFEYGEPKNAFLTTVKIKELTDVFESVSDDSNIELSFNELQFIILALDYTRKMESDWPGLIRTKNLIDQLLNISDTLQ